MKEVQRRQAMTAWRDIYALPESQINGEVRYDRLLRKADEMERADLITSDEWRKLAQEAGTLLAKSSECMGGSGD